MNGLVTGRAQKQCRMIEKSAMGMALFLTLSMASCEHPNADVQTVPTSIQVALTDAALEEQINSYVLSIFFSAAGHDCTSLLEQTPASLFEIKKDQQPLAVSQALCPNKLDENASCPDDGTPNRHLFADLFAPGQYSVMLLGSRLPYADSTTFFQLDEETNQKRDPLNVLAIHDPNVIALGCREVELNTFERQRIELVLFPAGLR